MSYKLWNDHIAKHFFNKEMAGREVLLYVNEDEINKIGKTIGKDFNNFIESVLSGPKELTSNSQNGICQKAFQTLHSWRNKFNYPPYIAYLSLFVLAGSMNDNNYSQSAYYPKLRKLLGEIETNGQLPSFNKMINLWNDLEKWTIEDKIEEFGIFRVRIRGGWRHVGIPLSQTILSTNEREKLPWIFIQAEDVLAEHSNDKDYLIEIILRYGSNFLSKKTLKLLNGEEKNIQLLNALLELIVEEFEKWDGDVPREDLTNSITYKKHARLKLCLKFDQTKRSISMYMRLNSKNHFPESEIFFNSDKYDEYISCYKSSDTWSSPLKKGDQILDPKKFNLFDDITLIDLKNTWLAKMKRSRIRIFEPGKQFYLPDYVEVPNIKQGSKFILLCTKSERNIVEEWGNISCDKFGEIQYKGLPDNYYLFQGINPKLPCDFFEKLRFPSEIIVKFKEGIRYGKGNTFLNEPLPKILIQNVGSNIKVYLNEYLLEYNENYEMWVLPTDTPINEANSLIIEVDEKIVRRTNFMLINPKIEIKTQKHFEDMLIIKNSILTEETLFGYDFKLDPSKINDHYSLPTNISKNIIFIGKNPGEILEWNRTTVQELTWRPIWAVYKRKRNWHAYYCATFSYKKSSVGLPLTDKKMVVKWKNFLVNLEKKNIDFKFKELTTLWKSYLEVAKELDK